MYVNRLIRMVDNIDYRKSALFECNTCNKQYISQLYREERRKHPTCSNCKNGNHRDGSKKNTRLYNIWKGMKTRCYNKNRESYKYYKDINVCKEWINNYKTFEEWSLANGYTDELTIDRKDGTKDYNPNNCRWTDKATQARNSSKRINNKSGYIGVEKRGNKWYSHITIKYKRIHLGSFNTPKEASKARKQYILDNNLEHKW